MPVELRGLDDYRRWDIANVVRGRANGTVSAYAYCKLGDITTDQFRGLAQIQRDFDVDIRITNRQNFVLRGLTEDQLPELHSRLVEYDMHEPGAELARDVVSCPGADTCNLAVTQSRGLASDIDRALDEAGLAEVGGVRINISGCTNSCGQHHISDIGFLGLRAPGARQVRARLPDAARRAPRRHGDRVRREGHQAAGEGRGRGRRAGRRAVRGRAHGGRDVPDWLARSGGAAGVGTMLKDLDVFPTPEENPDFYVDFDETGPYVAEVGDSECAT